MINPNQHLKLRKKFIEDSSIPISYYEGDAFMYYIRLYGFEEKWDMLVRYLDEKGMSDDEYLSMRSTTIASAVDAISSTDAYSWFCMEPFQIKETASGFNLYSVENHGKQFLTYDMKESNFQVMKRFDRDIVLGARSYADFISKFTDCQTLISSKPVRQVIFGKLNPHKVSVMSRDKAAGLANHHEVAEGIMLSGINNDEVFYEVTDRESVGELADIEYDGVVFRPSLFTLETVQYSAENGKTVRAFIKRHHDGRITFHACGSIYYAQVYKDVNGMPLGPYDLMFMHEGIPAQFTKQLSRI